MVDDMVSYRPTGFVDPGWEHGIPQDDKKKKVKCIHCGKIVSGGIYRLKQHLARISGEVTYCRKAPEIVYLQMKKNLEGCRFLKRQRQSEKKEHLPLDFHSNNEDEEEEEPMQYKYKGKQIIDENKAMVTSLAPLRSLGYVDPGWEHGSAQDERKKKVKCNYCEKIVSGGINRFKQHLARIPGEVASCKKAPEDVYLSMKENMKNHRTGRRSRQTEVKETSGYYMQSDNEYGEEMHEDNILLGRHKELLMLAGDTTLSKDVRKRFEGRSVDIYPERQLKRPRLDYSIQSTPRHVKLKTGSYKISRKEVVSAISRFFYHAAVPSHIANSPYFHKMLDLVGKYGQELTPPSSQLISGSYLQDEIGTFKEYLAEYRASWANTGCSVLADSWKDSEDRTMINFLASCPRGVYFISSIDATDIVEDPARIFKLLDEVVDEMGEDNVLQVITANTPSYKAAGKMLEEKRRKLFWTPCASYSIDRMLEDFMKIRWVAECIDKSKKVTKFIYNRAWLLSLMKREFTDGRELLKPGFTRFSTCFATLQNLLMHRIGLKRMFNSNKWLSSRFAKLEEGTEVEKIVLNSTFWKKVLYAVKSVGPMLQILERMDTDDGLPISSIYHEIDRAKLAIKAVHGDDMRKYGPFLDTIDNHGSSLFHHPLFVAAYFLNPSYRYRPDVKTNPEITRGVNECIVRLEPDNGRRIAASMQISEFFSGKADFGTELAISTRVQLDPAGWWQQHGINCLELQRIAVRILSQTCSSFGCQHNWSMYDKFHSKRHNILAQNKLNEFIYVHYNLRLRERQLHRKIDDSIALDNDMLENLLSDWIVEAEKQTIQLDEEIFYNELEQVEDESTVNQNQNRSADAREIPMEMLPLQVHPAHAVAATYEDNDLDLFDDEFTE